MTTQSLESLATELAHGLTSMSPDEQISAKKRFAVAMELMPETARVNFAIRVSELAEAMRHGQEGQS